MTENTWTTLIVLGAFIIGAALFCLAIYREMQDREAQRTKEAAEHRRYLEERAARWKAENERIAAIWKDRGRVIKPFDRYCDQLDEREPLT